MIYSPDLLRVADHCQHRSFITNRYTGRRIAVDCGQCDYCIHKRAQKASMRVKTAGSAFKYSYFVTLTYDNEHVPLMNCEVLHNEYEDALSISGDKVFGYERHSYIPVSEYQPEDSSQLRHIFFTQVQGTVPYDREIKEYVPVKDNWFLSMDAIRSFISKTQAVDNSVYPAAERYGINNLIPFLNYVDVQNYIKRLRKHLHLVLGSYETLHFYAVGEYGPVHFRPHYHILLFTNSKKSQRYYDSVMIRVGSSVVQISRLPVVELHRTLRVTLTALALLPYYIGHAAHLSPDKEHLSDSLKKVVISWKTKTLMRKLNKKSILSLTEESSISTGLVLNQLPPCRISVPYCPDSRVLAMTMLLRLLELFELLQARQKEWQDSVL